MNAIRSETRSRRSATRIVTLALVALVAAIPSIARAGTAMLDPSFGTGGIVTTDVFGQGKVNALVVLPDRRIVAAGTNNSVAILARYTEGGMLDPTFTDPNGSNSVDGIVRGPQGSAEAILRFSNGNFLTGGGGGFTFSGYAADGPHVLDRSFSSAAGFSLGWLYELIAVGDGTFIAAGEGYANRCALGKFTPPSLDQDTGFAGGGITQEPLGELSCRGLVRDPGTGHLYVTATRTTSGTNGFGVARFDASGALDQSFASGGVALVPGSGSFSLARALVRQPDGKVIVVGTAGSGIGSIPKAALVVRFDTNGQLDSTFGPAGIGLTVFGDPSATFAFNATAVVLQDDGRILVGGTVVGPSNVKDGAGPGAFVLTRFTADGQYDVAFGEDPSGTLVFTPFGTGVSAALHTMALQPDGKLLVAGEAGTSQTGFALARYIVSGASVTPSNSTTTTLPGGGGGGTTTTTVPGGSGGSTTTTTLPGRGAACAGATNLEQLHCLCAAGVAVPSCAGQPVPASVGSNVQRACAQVDQALAGPAKKKRTILGRGKTRLKRASATLRSHRSRKKIEATCRTDVETILGKGRSLIDALRAGSP
jgi:uncharacterized delta-60 repeat protein